MTNSKASQRDSIGRNPADAQWTHRAVPPGLIKGTEVAQMASVHAATVRLWVRKGLLTPVILPTGGRRYRRAEVMTLLGLDKDNEANSYGD